MTRSDIENLAREQFGLLDRAGLNQPIWAQVYGGTVRYSRNGNGSEPLKGTALPRIEPEIVFRLRAPLAGGDERSWLDSVE